MLQSANFESERPRLNKWIIRPLQKALALTAAAKDVAGFAIGANLAGMPCKGPPALDLNGVDVRQPPWNKDRS